MAEAEHLLNVHASSACRRAVAPFLGYLEVEQGKGRLTPGLWLMWTFEGDRTLAYYLRRRDCLAALAADLGVEEAAAVPTAMRQLFACLVELHAAGLVHRDVKPANVVVCAAERRLKLIDLGAAADLRTGTNYAPDQTILDPAYCPPEEYCLPTDAPHLSRTAAPLAAAMSPLLWAQHRPDAFDAWSCGVVLLQLALPFLRTPSALKNWRATYARCGYDLEEWRLRSGLAARATALLDADDGAGWALAAELLRPREVETDGRGAVRFVNTGGAPRLTPAQALRHPYLKGAGAAAAGARGGGLAALGSLFGGGGGGSTSVDEAEEEVGGSAGRSSSRGSGSAGSKGSSSKRAAAPAPAPEAKLGMWARMKESLYDLQARVMTQASETETQTSVVQQLREEVAAGRAGPQDLRRAEGRLAGMQTALQASAKELNSMYGGARGLLSSLAEPRGGSQGGGGAGADAGAAGAAAEQVVPAASPAAEQGGSGSGSEGGGGGTSAGELATNLIYNGLKLTGRALNAASDVASAVEKSISRAQEEAAERRAATSAFLGALRAMQPEIGSATAWEDAARALPASAAYASLSDRQRRQAFESYALALRRAERAAAGDAAAALRALLQEAAPGEGTSYPQFAARYAADPRFAGVAEPDRVAAFNAHLAAGRAASEAAAASASAARAAARSAQAAAAEADFRRLMQAHEAVLARGAPWAEVKRAMWADERWGAVPDARRRELHAEYVALLKEAGAMAPPPPPPPPAAAPAAPAAPSAAQLGFLREEQARLRAEYERMETKLKEMETALKVSLLEDGSVVEAERDGSVTFKFAEGAPPLGGRGAGAKGKSGAR
jgi:hypothetical protein